VSSVKILCPTDFSEHAIRALDFAIALAKPLGAEIEIVHVFQMPLYVGWEDGPAAFAQTARFVEQARASAATELSALEHRARAAQVAVTSRQVDGVPHQAIAELSAGVDLLVMGTHGRTGLSHLLVGSVAERVLRHAKCPVVTVPLARS
jgi:universal stress protein A